MFTGWSLGRGVREIFRTSSRGFPYMIFSFRTFNFFTCLVKSGLLVFSFSSGLLRSCWCFFFSSWVHSSI